MHDKAMLSSKLVSKNRFDRTWNEIEAEQS